MPDSKAQGENLDTRALTSMTPEELASELGLEAYRGRQLFRWIHAKGALKFEEMTDLPTELRERLSESHTIGRFTLIHESKSSRSGTKKVLLGLPGDETVESVLLRDKDRTTLCISTQVGCALKCSFCATGLSGYARNLQAGEIVEQVLYLLANEAPSEGRTPNIVYMGMGEPFRNYDETVKSIRLLMHKEGLGIGARKITVSTAGEVPGIELFADEGWQVRLSVSLHAANDELRDRLVPLNRKYNLERLHAAISTYQSITGRQITVEWCLLKGINDSTKDAEELISLVGDLQPFINLIPYNPVHGLEYEPPSPSTCRAFRDTLTRTGLNATLRVERGQDIDAACGQLRRRRQS